MNNEVQEPHSDTVMADLEDLAPFLILHNPLYLTLILQWLAPGDILHNCAPACKDWSTAVSQAWKSYLQSISPVLYDEIGKAINQNKIRMSPEMLLKQLSLSEYKSQQDAYNLPTDTVENYHKALEFRRTRLMHKDAILTMLLTYKQSQPQQPADPPALKLEDLLLVVHFRHLQTRTTTVSVVWNMNEVLEDGLIYGKGAPILTKDVEFRIPIESVPSKVFPDHSRSEWRATYAPASLDELGWEMMETSAISVQLYRSDTGKAISFERGQMMSASGRGSMLGCIRTNVRKSRIDPNPADFPLPEEDDHYFDPANIPAHMVSIRKGYPGIGFVVGVRNVESTNGENSNLKVGKMTIEVHRLLFELFPGHHRTTIRWKEDLRKHIQHMDWE